MIISTNVMICKYIIIATMNAYIKHVINIIQCLLHLVGLCIFLADSWSPSCILSSCRLSMKDSLSFGILRLLSCSWLCIRSRWGQHSCLHILTCRKHFPWVWSQGGNQCTVLFDTWHIQGHSACNLLAGSRSIRSCMQYICTSHSFCSYWFHSFHWRGYMDRSTPYRYDWPHSCSPGWSSGRKSCWSNWMTSDIQCRLFWFSQHMISSF